MSHTYAILDVSPAVYDEIRRKLADVDYPHAFHEDGQDEVIDMHGIALRREPATATLARIEAEDHPVRVMDVALEEDRRRDTGRGPTGSPAGPLPTLEEIEAELRYEQQQAQ